MDDVERFLRWLQEYTLVGNWTATYDDPAGVTSFRFCVCDWRYERTFTFEFPLHRLLAQRIVRDAALQYGIDTIIAKKV